MSLNGLDASAIVEAHQATLTESGGWLLLKYANRDTVELLNRGNGSVTEVRNAVQEYVEKSPLYGLLQYRRKRVILKYVPEGTSRLLQVRLSVQFQSILDSFVPHDTVFTFHAPGELTDSALGLCTMLLPSDGSLTSSTSSLRRPRLGEITEDAEEGPLQSTVVETMPTTTPLPQRPREIDSGGLPPSAIKAKALLAQRKEQEAEAARALAAMSTDIPPTPTSLIPTVTLGTQAVQQNLVSTNVPYPPRDGSLSQRLSPSIAASIPKSLPVSDGPHSPGLESIPLGLRKSVYPQSIKEPQLLSESVEMELSQPAPVSEELLLPISKHLSSADTNSISQWTNEVAAYTLPALPKQKKKLAPRPHVDAQTRPKTSSSNDDSTAPSRKVANLPNSVRVSMRPSNLASNRPGSQQSSRSVPGRFIPSNDHLPPLPNPNLSQFQYRPSEVRKPPSIAPSAVTDFPNVAPEKLRLMKALQMRKRNQVLNYRSQSAASAMGGRYVNIDSFPGDDDVSSPANSDPQMTSSKSIVKTQYTQESDLNRKHESTNTSPASTLTMFGNISTKPSSVSDATEARTSKESISSKTDSSTTPTANTGKPIALQPPQIITALDCDDSDDEPRQKSTTPAVSPIEEAFMRLTGTTNTPEPRTPVDSEHFIDQNSEARTVSSPQNLDPNRSTNPEVSSAIGRRRRGFDTNFRTPSSANSDASDDESFMEELQNATVHEAKPVSMLVTRSPVTPVSSKATPEKVRASQQALVSAGGESPASTTDGTRSASRAGSSKSISTALPQWPPISRESVPAMPSKKPVLSHGISKRIKALEVLSSRDSVSASPPTSLENTGQKTSFSSLAKRSSFLLPTPTSNPPIEKPTPNRLLPRLQKAEAESDSTARPWVQRKGSNTEIFPPAQKGETVSVTARIVRDRHVPGGFANYNDASSLNLHRSPLIVEHDPPLRTERSMNLSDLIARSPTSETRRPSFSSHKSGSQPRLLHSDSMTSRFSLSSSNKKKSPTTTSETSSITEEKKTSRASRIMQRFSGFGSRRTQKQQLVSPTQEAMNPATIHERMGDTSRSESVAGDSVLHVVDIGDVNVQFPESPLWKRRFLRIDDQGMLIFAAPMNDYTFRGVSRKYHLAEIKPPTLPDREREQMAWSVMLDLQDGGCIQCACENRQAQQHVLKMLIDAHKAYNQLYN